MNVNYPTYGSLRKISIIVKIFLISISLIIMVFSKITFLLTIIAILPSIVALFIDKRINRYASSTLCAFNLTSIVPYLTQLLDSFNIEQEAYRMINDIYVWLAIYSFTSLGWLIIWLVPQLTGKMFNNRAVKKIEKINIEQVELIATWGLNDQATHIKYD